MAEEVRNADIVVPWSMVITTLINGALGFGILIAVLFVTVDINAILESAPAKVGYPVVQIVYDATGSLGGATTMIAILVFLLACCTMATLATASRLVWAFARDRGLPFWSHVSKVISPRLLKSGLSHLLTECASRSKWVLRLRCMRSSSARLSPAL